MSDGATLFVVLSALYLWECFVWVGKHTLAFVSSWNSKWTIGHPISWLGNGRGSLVLVNPFCPYGTVVLCHLSPISISPEGVCLYNSQSLLNVGRPQQSMASLTFDEIHRCTTEGSSLVINDGRLVNCASFEQARSISDLINAAIPLSRLERARLVGSFISRRFAREEARHRLNTAEDRLKAIRITCSIFFLFLFVIVPLLVIFSGYGLNDLIIPIALIMIGFTVAISVMFYSAHKELYPDLKGERVTNLVKLALCPPGAIRVADLLAADVVSSFDPLVIATLLAPKDMDKFAASYSRDLKFPLKHELSEQRSVKITEWYNGELLGQTLRYLKQLDTRNLEHLFAAPPRDKGSLSYCPRCQSQFNVADGECPDCPGVALTAYRQILGRRRG